MTANTPLAPQAYEWSLLERFARSELTIDEVLLALDTQVQHVLYRSQTVASFSPLQLTALLEESRAYNETYDITGLLCYSAGHFVQLLEGTPAEVQHLYAAIRRDPRHHHVQTLREGTGPSRFFADWRMAFVEAPAGEFHWLLTHLEARQYRLVLPQVPICDPQLLTLLQAFSQAA